MAGTGFGAADFTIVPNGDQLPTPQRDAQGFKSYSATLMLPSRNQYNTLAALFSIVDLLPALGGGGMVVQTGGAGRRTLTYPMQGGTEETSLAYLTSLSAEVRILADGYITADAVFQLVDS